MPNDQVRRDEVVRVSEDGSTLTYMGRTYVAQGSAADDPVIAQATGGVDHRAQAAADALEDDAARAEGRAFAGPASPERPSLEIAAPPGPEPQTAPEPAPEQ